MKIALINLGLIEIPPKSWGAIEKIIWNYKIQLEKLGHQVDIVYPTETMENDKQKYDIVHMHAANQCLEMYNDFQTPYVFSLHDHHVVRYGKLSTTYSNNLLAMKKSVASFCHAEFLIDYFDTTDKLYYLSHGVDTDLYKDFGNQKPEHKLLCVANNGYANDPSYDRKGFRYAIEAAIILNLPITIVGPKNNKLNFFKDNPDLLKYSNLTIIEDPSETELIKIFNEHTIFLHPSELEAGHPNLTLLEAMSCGIPIVGTYEGKTPLEGLIKAGRNTNNIVDKIKLVINDYDNWRIKARQCALKYDWPIIVKQLESYYTYTVSVRDNFTRDDMKKHVVNAYETGIVNYIKHKEPKINYNVNFNDGAFFEMLCLSEKKVNVDFIDKDTNSIFYNTTITSNHWCKPNLRYFKNWMIKVTGDDNKIFDFNLKDKNVLIQFESKSIGDSMAWIPYVDEFRKKHNCKMYCSTFLNFLYEKEYPEVNFIEPGTGVNDLYATYRIGWFSNDDPKAGPIVPWGGDRNVQPNDYRTIPLQQTITDIIGLPFKELRPKITIPNMERPIPEKYVVIAEHSTANAKHWLYRNGWQTIVDYINSKGYKVMVISKQGTTLKRVIVQTGDQPLERRINQIKHSEFMITIGSGLSWIAWSTGKKVIMISGFSKPFCEFQENNIRIINENVCNGCFNDIRYSFNRGDYYWCPAHKSTPRQHECTKTITPQMVIDAIENNNLINE